MAALVVLALTGEARAQGTLTIPNIFGGRSTAPIAQFDSNWEAIRAYVNAREITLGTLANRPAAGVSGRLYVATDQAGNTLYEDTGSAWSQIAGGATGSTFLFNGVAAPASPVTGNTFWLNPTLNYLTGYDGTGFQSDVALATKVINTADPRWGCKFDQVTDDAACINAAIAAAPTLTGPGDLGTIGGATILVPKIALIKSTLKMPGQNTGTISLALQCLGRQTSGFIWGGGNNADMVTINRADNGNTIGDRVSDCGFWNQSTSGTGLTAVRALNVNGIRLGSRTVGTSGQNDVMIERNFFQYLSNGIISENANGPVALTIRNNLFSLLYNQTSPVVNPVTDAVVLGRGNAIYFDSATLPQQITLSDNDATVQQWFFDSQASNGVPGFVAIGNIEQSTNNFSGGPGGIRVAALGPGAFIAGNQLNCRSGTFCLDLGTTSLGGSNVSGGIVTGNYLSGLSTNGTGLRLTFADAVTVEGNTFFSLATGINLVGANVTRPRIGVNSYTTVTTKVTDGGAVTPLATDIQLGGIGIGTAAPASPVAGWTPVLDIKGTFPGLVLRSTSANGRIFSIGSNVIAALGELDFYDETASAKRGFIASTGGLVWGPTGVDGGAGTINISTADGYLVNNTALKNITETLSNKTAASPVLSGTATGTYTLGGTPTINATTAGSYQVGGASLILSGTTGTITPGALLAGQCASGTVTITGATTSMVALADPNTYPGDGTIWDGQVTSADTVTVKVCAIVALTPAASTYNVRVLR